MDNAHTNYGNSDMMETVFFSVIIPIYEVEQYLRECLDSIIRQTLKNFEIICVDDASTDGSGNIVREYAAKDIRIRYISHGKNRGLGAARNTGLDLAKGRYVLFVDADDFLSEDTLQILFETAERECVQVIYFNAEEFYENDPSHTSWFFPDFEQTGIITGRQVLVSALNDHYFRGSACTQCWLRDALKRNCLRFPEGIYHEDTLFSLRSQLVVKRAVIIPNTLYHYRVHRNSIMRDPDKLIARKMSLLYIYGETIDIMQTTCKENPLLLQPFYNFLDTLSVMLDLTYTTAHQHHQLEDALDPDSREYCIYRFLKGSEGCFIDWGKFDQSILKRYPYIYIYGNGRVAAEVLDHLGGCCSFSGVVSTNGDCGFWHGFHLVEINTLQAETCLIYAPDIYEPLDYLSLKALKGVHVYYPPR